MRKNRPARSPKWLIAGFEPLEGRLLYSTTYDIVGVQPAAIDQPQVHAIFRNSPTGNPLGGTGPDDGYSVKGYLDTGASGVLISLDSADALGFTRATQNGQPIEFTDVGVAGGEAFDVSNPVYGALAPVRSVLDDDIPVEDFNQSFGPVRTQIGRTPSDELIGDINVIGMPAMQGRVVVMDPTPLNATDISLLDGMKTYVYAPGTPYSEATKTSAPGIPAVNRHVKLSYGDFARFTHTTPAGAAGPTLATNPFIGPNPVRAAGVVDNTPGVGLTEGARSVQGSFLLDTGAAASFVSENIAGQLGYHYRAGTFGTDNPVLEDANGVAVPGQFTLPIGGIGGSVTVAGFRADTLSLPTTEGEPIRFVDAPVLVLDITVADPVTGVETTLDGDFGMNFLVASLDIDGTVLGEGSAGAFDWVTFDQPNGVLGLNLPDAGPVVPPPPLPSTIGGTLYTDRDANGTRDAGEPGVGGRTVYLDVDGSNTLTAGDVSTVTASDGSYSFAGLTGGNAYKIRQVLPTGWKAGGPTGGSYSVTPAAGAVVGGKDFGSFQQATLKGVVFTDVNANSAKDAGDTGLSGWTVWLDLNNNGTKDATDRSTTTDSAGNYTFAGLDPKSYAVRVVGKTGYRQSLPTAGKAVTAVVTSGQTLTGQNVGFTKRASVAGTVFVDANKNGVKESAEGGLPGWKVYLDTNKNGKWDAAERSTLTSSTGGWAFNDLLAGTSYAIRVVQQTGWTRTAPSSGVFTLTPTAAQVMTGKNFGERK